MVDFRRHRFMTSLVYRLFWSGLRGVLSSGSEGQRQPQPV
jgi:hypothetical protein